jgi:hypothetical protein
MTSLRTLIVMALLMRTGLSLIETDANPWVYTNEVQVLNGETTARGINLINNSTEQQHVLIRGNSNGTLNSYLIEQSLENYPASNRNISWKVTISPYVDSVLGTTVMAYLPSGWLVYGKAFDHGINVVFAKTTRQYISGEDTVKAVCGSGGAVTTLLPYSDGFTDMIFIGTNTGIQCFYNLANNNMSTIINGFPYGSVIKTLSTTSYLYARSSYASLVFTIFAKAGLNIYSPSVDEPYNLFISFPSAALSFTDALAYRNSYGTYVLLGTSYGVLYYQLFTSINTYARLFNLPDGISVTAMTLALDGNYNDLLVVGCSDGSIYSYSLGLPIWGQQLIQLHDPPYGASAITKLIFNWELIDRNSFPAVARPVIIASNAQSSIILFYLDGSGGELLASSSTWITSGQSIVDMIIMDYRPQNYSSDLTNFQHLLTVSLSTSEVNYLNDTTQIYGTRNFMTPTPSQNQAYHKHFINFASSSETSGYIQVESVPSFHRVQNELHNNHPFYIIMVPWINGLPMFLAGNVSLLVTGYGTLSNENRTDQEVLYFVNETSGTSNAILYENITIPIYYNSELSYRWYSTRYTRFSLENKFLSK